MKRSQFELFDQVRVFHQEDPYCTSIQKLIGKGTPSSQDFTKKDGILYFKEKNSHPKEGKF